MAEEIEDDDFNLYPGGKSRLSNLFPTQHVVEGDVNQSLTYVAPKQPKKNDGQQPSSGENLKLVHAIAAYTYKLEDGQYKTQGKFGVAILGDNEKHVYKLLLYKGKQQTITISTIQSDFEFAVEPNNYAKFPDDKGEQWSITFNSEGELVDFTKQVAVAKANSFGKNLSALVVQDLTAGEGVAAEMGDALQISSAGSLLKNHKYGEVFDSSGKEGKRILIELGKANTLKGWNEGLTGAKKGLRRLLIMPSSFSYEAGNLPNLVTPNDILIFEVFIHKIKRSADRSRSPSASKSRVEKKPDVPPRTHSVSNDDIRSRGASLSEQLTQSPRKDTAQLISRIAKMGGTNILGQGVTSVQTSSESEPEKEAEQEPPTPRSRKHSGASPKHIVEKKIEHEESPVIQPRRSISSPIAASPVIQNTIAYATPQSSSESFQFLHQPYVGLPHMIPSLMPPAVPSLMENHLPLLVAETRTQNTEMRITLCKLNDKVETVIQKIDDIRLNQGSFRAQGPAPYMESTILAQNIERVVQENIQMKHDLEAKNSKIHELNEKVCDILQRNQRFFEESNNILEQRSDKLSSTSVQFETRIQNLELEKIKLSSELKESISRASDIQSQLHNLQKQVHEFQERLKTSEAKNVMQKEEIQMLESRNKENEDSVEELKSTVESLTQEKKQLVSKLQNSQNRFSEAENIMEQLESKMVKQSKSTEAEFKEEIKVLQEKLQRALEYKKKFEILYENTRQMKSKYELQISQLLANQQKSKSDSALQPSSVNFSTEIRKTMNKLYKFLQNEIEKDHTYSGAEVLDVCLGVIKRTTFTILGKGQMQEVSGVKSRSESERSLAESSQSQENSTKGNQSEGHSKESTIMKDSEEKVQSEQNSKESSQLSNKCDKSEEGKQFHEHKEIDSLQNEMVIPSEELSAMSSGDQPLITKMETSNAEATSSSAGESATLPNESLTLSETKSMDETCAQISSSETSVLESSSGDKNVSSCPESRKLSTEVVTADVPIFVNSVSDSTKEEDIDAQLDKVMESDTVKKSEELQKLTPAEGQEHQIPDTTLLSADTNKIWRPQPSPPPLFDEEEEDEDDWLK